MKGAKQKEMFEITNLRREILHLRSVCPFFPRVGGGGGGGRFSDIFIQMWLQAIFRGSKFLVSIFLRVFRKLNIFGGMKILCFVECFWGHHKIGIYLEVISMHFRVFLKVRVRNGGCFWGC